MKRRKNQPNASGESSAAEAAVSTTDALPLRPLIAISLAFAIMAGLFSAVSPFRSGPGGQLNSNPDEQVHYEYIEALSGGHLPVFTSSGANYEAHQPPLYYALCVPANLAFRSLSADSGPVAVRWISIALGVALIWATYLATRRVFADEPIFPLACAALVAAIPMNISLCSSISNDALTNLVAAVGLWQLARLCRNARTWIEAGGWTKQTLLLGVVIGVGIWTKTSTLLLIPVSLISLGVLFIRTPDLRRSLASGGILACLAGVVIGSPWLIRNTLLYGDPVAQHIFVTAFQRTAHTFTLMAQYHLSLPQMVFFWTLPWTFESFWGVFDSMRLFLPVQVYGLVLLFNVLSLAGLAAWAYRRSPAFDTPAVAIVIGFAAMFVLTAAAFVRFNMIFFQAQGRYFYTALAPIAFFMMVGLRQLEPQKYRYKLVGLFLAILVVLDLGSIATVARHFSPQ